MLPRSRAHATRVLGSARLRGTIAGLLLRRAQWDCPSCPNMAEYLSVSVVAAVGGSWIVNSELILTRDWAEVTRRAREAVAVGGASA